MPTVKSLNQAMTYITPACGLKFLTLCERKRQNRFRALCTIAINQQYMSGDMTWGMTRILLEWSMEQCFR